MQEEMILGLRKTGASMTEFKAKYESIASGLSGHQDLINLQLLEASMTVSTSPRETLSFQRGAR